MGSASPVVDIANLGLFSPLDRLEPARAEALLAHARVERVPPGRRLFNIGDSDGRTLFLLSGQIALVGADHRIRILKAATPEAGQAIADEQPREAAALARTAATVLSVESALLSSMLAPEDDAARPASGPPSADAALPPPDTDPVFASPLFSRLPAPHLQVLKQRMHIVEVAAGDVVIREGDDSASYHLIESGRFRVTRRERRRGRKDEQNILGRLAGFGEAALIANEPYDCTVTALEAGRLLRFPKGEFLTLIVRPFIRWIGRDDIARSLHDGGTLLDVRSWRSHARNRLQDSVNLPLQILRQVATILDRERRYIICGDNMRRSAAAAFLIAQQGIEVMILNETVRSARGGSTGARSDQGSA